MIPDRATDAGFLLDIIVQFVYHRVMATHRLLTLDVPARRGTCSECGTTDLAKKGDRWRCAAANRTSVKKWKSGHKDAVKGQRARNERRRAGKPLVHEIAARDTATLTGECLECGTVQLLRQHRGWVCNQRGFGCKCNTELLWRYGPADTSLCELCCFALSRLFVQEGLLEPVLELTWPENRVSWDSAIWELEAA